MSTTTVLRAARTPRAFCGDCFPWPLIEQLTDGNEVVACFLVHAKQRGETRAAKPFLAVQLGDRSGTIAAKVWDDADRLDALFAADDIIGVRGRVKTYQERLEIHVQTLEPLRVDDEDLQFFLPTSPRCAAEMAAELDALVESIRAEPLRALLWRCVGAETRLGRQFRVHPAAKRLHHAYLGGLLEHSLSVASCCERLRAHYQAQGASLDRDVLIAGALLHDIGKTRELKGQRSFGYSDEGQLLGHILIGLQLVAREAEAVPGLPPETLLHLQHLIASHQGRPEWDSPRLPLTLEALILHMADDLDAKLNATGAALRDVPEGGWSAYQKQTSRSWYHPPALRSAPNLEPSGPDEVTGVLIDLFRG